MLTFCGNCRGRGGPVQCAALNSVLLPQWLQQVRAVLHTGGSSPTSLYILYEIKCALVQRTKTLYGIN